MPADPLSNPVLARLHSYLFLAQKLKLMLRYIHAYIELVLHSTSPSPLYSQTRLNHSVNNIKFCYFLSLKVAAKAEQTEPRTMSPSSDLKVKITAIEVAIPVLTSIDRQL